MGYCLKGNLNENEEEEGDSLFHDTNMKQEIRYSKSKKMYLKRKNVILDRVNVEFNVVIFDFAK